MDKAPEGTGSWLDADKTLRDGKHLPPVPVLPSALPKFYFEDAFLQPAPELPGYTIIARARGDLATEFQLADSHLRRITALAKERDAHAQADERGIAKLRRHIDTMKAKFAGRIDWHTARLAEWAGLRRPAGGRKKHLLPCGEVGFVVTPRRTRLNPEALTLLVQQGRADWLFEAGIATYKLSFDERKFGQVVDVREDGSVVLKATGAVIDPVQVSPAAPEAAPWDAMAEDVKSPTIPLWIETDPGGERLALKVHTGDLDAGDLWQDLDEPDDMNEEDDNGYE